MQSVKITPHDIEHIKTWGKIVEKSTGFHWNKSDSKLFIKLGLLQKELLRKKNAKYNARKKSLDKHNKSLLTPYYV